MRIGIYLDLRNPPEWRRPWPDFYRQSLDLAGQAEEWGADSVWLSEHHFFEDGYLPQPLTFAAAVAARTRRIRIGTAVVLAPLRLAVQIAEEAVVVDQISNGRLDLGLGAGYAYDEFEAYRRRPVQAVHHHRPASAGSAGAAGRRCKVTPPPVQSPFPIWLGYNGPQGARRAGRLGCGLLSINPASVAPYTEGLAEGGPPPGQGPDGRGGVDGGGRRPRRGLRAHPAPSRPGSSTPTRQPESSGTGKTPSPLTVEMLRERRMTIGDHAPAESAHPRRRHRASALAGRGHPHDGGLLLVQHRRHARRFGPPPRRAAVYHRPRGSRRPLSRILANTADRGSSSRSAMALLRGA